MIYNFEFNIYIRLYNPSWWKYNSTSSEYTETYYSLPHPSEQCHGHQHQLAYEHDSKGHVYNKIVIILPNSRSVSTYPELSISMLVLLSNINTGGGLVCTGVEYPGPGCWPCWLWGGSLAVKSAWMDLSLLIISGNILLSERKYSPTPS